MRSVLQILTSRLSNKIIVPYLLLALCLAIAVTFVVVQQTAGALQDRMNNRLIEAGQVTSDGLVAVEDRQIEQLRAIAFTEGVAEALAAADQTELEKLLRPYWANVGLAALVVFDAGGRPLISWARPEGARADMPPQEVAVPDLASWWIVQQIVNQRTDAFGDKFSSFHDRHLYTAAPVDHSGQFVGGVMVGMPIDLLLRELQGHSQAGITTFYDATGRAVATTQVVVGEGSIPAIPADVLPLLWEVQGASEQRHVQSVVLLNGREHQFAYSPLRVRRAMNGFFSVSLPRSFIVDTWSSQQLPLVLLSLALVAAVVAVGMIISRHITRPLRDLVDTARAVTNGQLQRRSTVTSRDELGVVARSFNQMTERLLHLYETSRNLSAQTQIGAILAQTEQAVQPLVPGAVVLALLRDRDSWQFYCGDGAEEALQAMQVNAVGDDTIDLILHDHPDHLWIAPVAEAEIQVLGGVPTSFAEAAITKLMVQGRLIGLLLLLHRQHGMFAERVLEPLVAVAGMAATALHNTRLYLEIQEEGNRRRVILESIADGVVVCDAQHHVVLMNPAAESLLRIHDWTARRYRFDDLPLEPVSEAMSLLGHNEETQTRYTAHGQILRANSARLSTSTQTFGGEVIILQNISQEVALDQAKTDLIAMISHELRTPLTTILSTTDMLRNGIGGKLSEPQLELVEMAARQSRAMNALIEKAILVARIEAGTLECEISPIQVRTVIDMALGPLREAATQAGVDLRIEIPTDLPPVLGDMHMLKVAFQQILDNAIKYGNAAPILIVARCTGSDVVLAVRDFGPGIPDEAFSHLFRPLQRGAGSSNTAQRGLGLGLLIARELIERQNGTIRAQSRLGQGSLFWIVLPGASHEAYALAA